LLIYPERRGQPKGRLDWGIVALDGLGLLLFLVPGVVAFIVDFATGTIYLPPEAATGVTRGKKGDRLAKVEVPRAQISKRRIEELVSTHVGRPVRLADGEFQTVPLDSVDEYWTTVDQMADGTS
jgi:hypothetical protein